MDTTGKVWYHSHLGISGCIIVSASFVVSVILYSNENDAFWIGHQILCNLVWGPHGSGMVLRAGIVVSLAFIVPYFLLTFGGINSSYKWLSDVGMVCIMLSICGVGMFVIFPEQKGQWVLVHVVGSGMHAVMFAISADILTLIMATAGTGTAMQAISAAGVTMGVIGMSLAVIHATLVFGMATFIRTTYSNEWVEETIASVLLDAWWFPMSELIYVLCMCGWIGCTSMATLVEEKRMARHETIGELRSRSHFGDRYP
jgi:hypothetical protein